MADKYKKLKRQVSNDGGMTWQDMIPYEYITGELIERDSPDCNNVEWRTVSGYICEENTTEMTQWVADTGYVCVGFDKKNKEKEQVSYNSGISWADTGNTRAGSTLIEANSEDCGYIPPHDYSRDYLTTEALNSGNMKLTNQYQSGIQYYSKNNGSWTSYTQGSDISVVAGDVIRWKGTVANNGRVGQFGCTCNYKAYGNTLSLLKGDNFIGVTDISGYENAVLMGLFVNQTTLMDVSNLILSATTLGNLCYFDMFRGCTSLTSVPALPATTLSSGCYRDMFEGCTSLTSVPALPATTLANTCYNNMFSGCTSLTSVPSDLLPATTLNQYCYYSMFEGCTSLTNAPVLPATTLVNYCYYRMFYGCTSLNRVTCCATDISASNCTSNWLYNVAATGTFNKDANTTWSTGVSGIPSGWTTDTCGCEPTHDYSREYLTISSLEDNNEIRWKAASRYFQRTISVSTDNGQTWTKKASSPDTGTTLATLNAGDKLLVKGLNSTYRDSLYYFIYFSTTKDFSIYGNIMSLIGGDDFANITSFTNKNVYAFGCLFWNCSHLVDASNLILPATTLAESCYDSMFKGCTSLTTAPALPATTLDYECYANMFEGCTSLTTAPVLPSTSLDKRCYANMFQGCTSLTTAPALPATTLASMCYESMFEGCTSLTTAILPATELAYECYYLMFQGCTSLTTAPALPATTLAEGCYESMFIDCTSLTTAPALPATKLAMSCYAFMFQGCTSLTTVILPATSLSNQCYAFMFQGCTSLTTAPDLPATSLAYACYGGMFKGCTSLTTAPDLPATALSLYCYQSMFQGCTSLTTTPELPATSLSNECYKNMFKGCTSLTTAPALPATTLDGICYESMFEGCTSLTTAPELPATTLRNYCYDSMFKGCTSLTTAPALPATSLSSGCYRNMFDGCTGLTAAPALPSTTLANYCYQYMFQGCTSLTTAPDLPATTLVEDCYKYMFADCTSLNYIKCLATNIYASNCTTNWLQGVSSTGTFVKNAAITSRDWGRGDSGIPSGWTVQDA